MTIKQDMDLLNIIIRLICGLIKYNNPPHLFAEIGINYVNALVVRM